MINQRNFPLKNISWVKIGGNAKNYIEVENDTEFRECIINAKKNDETIDIIGWGANTLISDNGLETTVIKNRSNNIQIFDNFKPLNPVDLSSNEEETRHSTDQKMVELAAKHALVYEDIYYDDSNLENIYVRVGGGTGLPLVINSMISKGITGLQMFSGIPGTMGASVFNNIHGGPKLMQDYIYEVEVIDKNNKIFNINHSEIDWAYNSSTFQSNGYIILSIVLQLKAGEKDRALKTSVGWAKMKANQPKNSLGSVFHNLTKEEKEIIYKETGIEAHGTGYLIDHILKLGGYRVGNIMIPEDLNKNIFVNLGNGTASEFIEVMKKVYTETYNRFGIKLKPEVFLKGFLPEEISEFN